MMGRTLNTLAPPPVPPPAPVRLAALDLGTNNCRLLVAETNPDGFAIIDSFSRITRLGDGLARSGRLSEAAQARTLAALRVCAKIIERHGVSHARCVTTEACRRAENGALFLARARKATGIDLELISSDEESRLALMGCLPLIDQGARHIVLLDIGGGSTEFLWLDRAAEDHGAHLRCALSVPCGVVTLSDLWGEGVEAVSYQRMVETVRAQLVPLERRHAINAGLTGGPVQMIGTSGTVTTLAALALDLRRYDRRRVDGTLLSFEALQRVAGHLRAMPAEDRQHHPCIGPGRADLVIAGCAILDAVHATWPIAQLRVADRGVREGILQGLLGRELDAALAGLH